MGKDEQGKKPDGEARAPRDLRYTEHVDREVEIVRDLSGPSEFLALGSRTHFHELHFRLRPRVAATNASENTAHAPAEVVSPPTTAPSINEAVIASPSAEPHDAMSKFKKWLGVSPETRE